MKDIDRAGIAPVVEQALAIAGRGTAGIHVSFDLDVCDPSIAPGVGTPVKGGLDYREAHMVMEMVADSACCARSISSRSTPPFFFFIILKNRDKRIEILSRRWEGKPTTSYGVEDGRG